MESIRIIVSWMVALFILALLVMVLYRLLTGKINTQYLFYGQRSDGTRYFSPERIQLMIFTLWIGLSYLLDTYETQVVHLSPDKKPMLPDVPAKTLALLGASHAVYLTRKAYSMLVGKITKGV
jgi:hypothetical protein